MPKFINGLEALLGLNRLSVSKKLLVLTLLFLSVISAMVTYTIITLDAQKSDGSVINIAGRQRMLTQKFTKEFYLALQQAKGENAHIDSAQMNKSKELFSISLKALSQGGKTYLDLGMKKPIELPGTDNPQINNKLKEVDILWQQLQAEVAQITPAEHTIKQLAQINKLSTTVLAKMNQAVVMLANDSDNKVQSMLGNQIWIWAFAVFASIMIAWIIANNITIPLSHVVISTQRISNGDLKAHPQEEPHRDELGALMIHVEKMRSVLSDVIHTVQQNSKQMSHSSLQIATISGDISSISKQEQESSKQVLNATTSLQQIATTVSEHIQQTTETAEKTNSIAEQGVNVVQQSINELSSAVDSVNITANQMESVRSATDRIHTIIEAIDNIAAQTNLLALNAAIEAARAGEHGRGFAVVADEVRNLASRTAESTTEITGLIGELTTQVEGSVESMQQVTIQVHQSQEKSEQTLSAFDAMTEGIHRNTENTAQIAQLNQQQAEQLTSLHSELNELFNVLELSTEKAGSTSLVANDLHIVSEELDKLLAKFSTDSVAAPVRKTDEQRYFPRIDNRIKVILEHGENRSEGITQDISMTGIQVKCLQPFEGRSDQTLQVHLYLPREEPEEEEEVLVIQGRIVHTDENSDGIFYGVNFNSMDNSEENKLKDIFDYFKKAHNFA